MAVDSKTAEGRRTVSYGTYTEFLADAEALAAGEVEAVGNWSLGQALKHLAGAFRGSLDGMNFQAPLPMRIMLKFMKKKMLTKTLPAGFKFPPALAATVDPPENVSTEEALQEIREVCARLEAEPERARHPFLGDLTREEWDQFNLRHAELHMSFLKPAGS